MRDDLNFLNVYFYSVNDEDASIVSFVLPSLPFRVGERVQLEIKNHYPGLWTVEDMEVTEFEVVEITTILTKVYGSTISSVQEQNTVIVKVKPI